VKAEKTDENAFQVRTPSAHPKDGSQELIYQNEHHAGGKTMET
jgi:hypothetical protein